MDLKNKVIVITGSSKGLGKGLAKEFIKQGSIVILNGRKKANLNLVSAELNCFAETADVSNEQDLIHLSEQVVKKYGRIDIWINNAGSWLPRASIENTDWKKVHALFEVNFFGTVYGSKTALMQMRKQNSGCIVNILSTGALEGRAGSSGYRSSKYAAAGFTKCLEKEVEGAGISVIAVYPGGMQTNLFDALKPENYKEYMPVEFVAGKIVENLLKNNLQTELIIDKANT